MRDTNMTITLYVLVVFVTSVCQGAAAPVQRLDCVTERDSDCTECICKAEILLQNCSSREPCPELFPGRRKRQAEDVPGNVAEAQPVLATSTEPVVATQPEKPTSADPVVATQPEKSTSTEPVVATQPERSTSTEAGVNLSTSAAPTSASPVNPSLPPPPHPATTQATAVKLRSCKSGSTWEEECNTCWCLDNGMAACTVKRCEVGSPLAGTQTTKSASPAHTTPVPSTSVQTSVTKSPASSTSQPSPTTSVSDVTSSVQDTTTTSLPSTTAVRSSTSPPVSSTSLSGVTS